MRVTVPVARSVASKLKVPDTLRVAVSKVVICTEPVEASEPVEPTEYKPSEPPLANEIVPGPVTGVRVSATPFVALTSPMVSVVPM